jgi:CTP:molybdopterin cytidylyltransferase MocA
VAVVTLPELADLYRDCVAAEAVDDWILHAAGGGTAATCLAAAQRLADRATHLWLHPVDLPLVAGETLAALAARSMAEPGEILVPRQGGVRGHPVLTPLPPWRGLSPADHPGPMRDLLAACAAPLRFVDVPDPGVRLDFDRPEDLAGSS